MKSLAYVVKTWCTLHNNEIRPNRNPDPNIWWNAFFVKVQVVIDESNPMLK